jgi:hypothetical protein
LPVQSAWQVLLLLHPADESSTATTSTQRLDSFNICNLLSSPKAISLKSLDNY